jgi:ubiquinone/menaquinone biosynthesis C-methylase UbiE
MKMTAIEKRFVNRPSHTRAVNARARQLLSHVDYRAGWRYLDVGCGVGTAAREIAGTNNLDVTGIDVDPKQVEVARTGPARPNLHFQIMDATRLDFRDGEFDIVAASMVTHHIPNWERAVAEMVRVLRRGGYLIYSDLMFGSWLAKLGRFLLRFAGFPSPNALDSLAATAGLVKVHQSKMPGGLSVIWVKNG